MGKLGIYIHVPFCIRKCNYCDFCSFADGKRSSFEQYTDELCRRIRDFSSKQKAKMTVDTVYFGGGTPTLLPIDCFERLMGCLRDCFDIEPDSEITVECNPASINKSGLFSIRSLGINRISIGLQSANDKELKLLGRLHSFSDFYECFDDARAVGFDNISADLMYGIPEQTVDSFENSIRELIKLSPEHISAYGLKIEEGTAFARNKDKLVLPNEDEEYEMYCICNEILKANGYHRYEISNFARRGRESRHNLRYWHLEDYVGFGVAAYSCFDGERFGNSRNMTAFLDGKDISCEKSAISDRERLNEYVMLGLRLEEGIDPLEYEKKFGGNFKTDFPETDKFISAGFMKEERGRISFTTKGFFVSNAILSDMLSFD